MRWLALGLALAALAIGVMVWRRRRRARSRLVSIVGLLREPMTVDPAVLARVAGELWGADLGDGNAEGADGFVVGNDVIHSIRYAGRFYLVNTMPAPYVQDVEAAATSIADLRIRELFREQAAWFSCDALGVDARASDQECREQYARLGPLFAELLDDRCVLILLPDLGRAYPINDETDAALRSEDPVGNLQANLTAPMVEVSGDDPLIQAATAQARREWPAFVAAFEDQAGESFSVKAPITAGDNTEFIWITVTSIEGGRLYGTLGNDPARLGSLRHGSKVRVDVEDIVDWGYLRPDGSFAGGFSIEAVRKAASRKRRG
jgi:uncharacterized protein YegJ (DUF2314 family)